MPNPTAADSRTPDARTPDARPADERAGDERAAEQDYVSMLYQQLDQRRRYTAQRLAEVLRGATLGTPQGRSERDAAAAMYSEQLAALDGVEQGLCFGRLDLEHDPSDPDGTEQAADGNGGLERRYIGRLGLLDEDRDYEPLLIDWRAPAARPFYTATAVAPEGVRRRRHIRTRSRTVLAVDDEVLDLDWARRESDGQDPAAPGRGVTLTSEATLMAALTSSRTGRMSDIVATIQAEQDRIIRAKPQGVLVVQGGPGTGKTAVALHRAAYLLYTHRKQLAKRGVLVVGPNATFLRYIGQVLPSLGETSVLLSTVAELYPGLHARGVESTATAAVKGRAAMAKVLAAAVRDRQQVPSVPIELDIDGQLVRLDRTLANPPRTRARRSRRPHNEAKRIFHREMVTALAEQVAEGLGRDLLDSGDLADIRGELRGSPALTAVLDELWPTLSPEQLLTDLYADPRRLAGATRQQLGPADRNLLTRPAPDPGDDPEQVWTPADVPLLDEAAELLGSDGSAEAAREAAALREELQYAQGVLDILDLEEDLDPELLRATDLIDADRLADRQRRRRHDSTAERAAADRTWTYGHVIVDEAQELSPMAWRLLMRRSPSRSMTVVGDIAQTGDRAGASAWQEVLGPYVADRWRLEQLTINYRNPAEIAELADRVLAALDVGITPPQSVRRAGVAPRRVEVGSLAAELPAVVAEELAAVGDGRVAVLGPAGQLDELGTILEAGALNAGALNAGGLNAGVPEAGVPEAARTGDLDAPVTVLSVTEVKGLEFDAVVLVDPAAILAESPRGLNDLYVALTRATHHLTLVHPGDLPTLLSP